MRLIDADALRERIHEEKIASGMAKARLMEMIKDAPTIGGWISVKDRLPEDTGDHLVYTCKEYTGIFWFDRDKKEWIEVGDYPCIAGYITHWMPLPEPPNTDLIINGGFSMPTAIELFSGCGNQ